MVNDLLKFNNDGATTDMISGNIPNTDNTTNVETINNVSMVSDDTKKATYNMSQTTNVTYI